MGLIALLLIPLIIIFLTVFAAQQDPQGEAIQLIGGFMEVMIVNFLLIVLLFVLAAILSSSPAVLSFSPSAANLPLYGLGGLGVLQFSYVVPRSLYLRRRQRWARLKGVIAAAVIVALLNGGCWVFMIGVGGV